MVYFSGMANDLLAIQRLSNQRIIPPYLDQPEQVVRWMGAMQAQDYAQVVWAIGLRTSSARLTDVEEAIAARKILRTWPMRSTIHFVAAEDARWMVRLSAERMLAADRRRQEQLNLDEAVLEQCRRLFYDALRGDRQLTRPEMMTLLENAGISTENGRGYHILYYAALTGLICFGPMQDKQQTFALLDEWAPGARELPREEALAELAGRYFASHGPATLRDFTWWTGLAASDARAGLDAARKGLAAITAGGKEYWMAAGAPDGAAHDSETAHLLPGFDEYLLGYTERSAVLANEHAQKIVPGWNGVFRPILVIAGQVCGTWQRSIKKNSLEIALAPFAPLAIAPERLFAAARRYSDFMGMHLGEML
jgi:hypothetical protein